MPSPPSYGVVQLRSISPVAPVDADRTGAFGTVSVGAGVGVGVTVGRSVAAGSSLDGEAVGSADALAASALALGSRLIVASGVPLPASTAWLGVPLARAIPSGSPP